MSGKNVMSEGLSVRDGSLDQKMYLKGLINGAYIINITDESGKVLLNKKILITE